MTAFSRHTEKQTATETGATRPGGEEPISTTYATAWPAPAGRTNYLTLKTPHSISTFLVDGFVAGTWRYEEGHVHLKPFDRLRATARRELQDEARRLAVFHAD